MLRNKGFTIIELMVVIAVVGLLAALTIGGFRSTFEKTRLDEDKNKIRAFYQRTNRYAITDGWDYKMEIDRDGEFLRCTKDTPASTTKDSIGLRPELDLIFAGAKSPIVLTVNANGTVDDDDNIRTFRVGDSETGDTLIFYISPLGIMEVEKK